MSLYDDNMNENPVEKPVENTVGSPAEEVTPVYVPQDTTCVPQEPAEAPKAAEPQVFEDDNAVLFSGVSAQHPDYSEQKAGEPVWTEPRYEAPKQPTNSYYTPSYSNSWQPVEKPKKVKGEKKQHPFLRACAVVLAAALLSGVTSYFTVNAVLDSRSSEVTKEVVIGSARTESGESNAVTSVVSAGTLTANDIYNAAIDYQVVGINTSATTTNIWGQRTKAAVSGTGFVISEDGYIMTNYHVISYAVLYGGEITVMFEDGTERKVDTSGIVGYSSDNDVAVIKIDPDGLDLNPVVFGNSDELIVGEQVYAIGNPLGELTYTMTPGIVAGLDRIITTTDDDTGESKAINMFQISAAVNHGNSGGPVYNSRGEVIGIVTAKYQDDGVEALGFAIPINDAMNIAKQVIEKGYVASAALGIMCMSVSDYYQASAITQFEIPQGVIVSTVNEGSAAEKAGVLPDDIITAINGTAVSSLDELKLQLRRLAPGDEGTLTIYRNKEYITVSITFEESQTRTVVTDSDIDRGESDTAPSYNDGESSSGEFPWNEFFSYNMD